MDRYQARLHEHTEPQRNATRLPEYIKKLLVGGLGGYALGDLWTKNMPPLKYPEGTSPLNVKPMTFENVVKSMGQDPNDPTVRAGSFLGPDPSKAGKAAGGLLATLREVGGGLLAPIVWHGSPHKFKPQMYSELKDDVIRGWGKRADDVENLTDAAESIGLKATIRGSSHSNSKYVVLDNPVTGDTATIRIADHPQSGHALALHGPANIEVRPDGDLRKALQDALDLMGEKNELGAFDAAHIGRGEGMQTYGHGLYLADVVDTAGDYRARLGGRIYTNKKTGEKITFDHPDYQRVFDAEYRMNSNGYGDRFKEQFDAVDGGHLYKVDLPDEMVPRMLDWDAPLSEQPENVRKFFIDVQGYNPSDKAGEIVDWMNKYEGDPAEISRVLQEAGIPGIKYWDGGSRAAGDGTRNYVIFPGEEHNLKILSRD